MSNGSPSCTNDLSIRSPRIHICRVGEHFGRDRQPAGVTCRSHPQLRGRTLRCASRIAPASTASRSRPGDRRAPASLYPTRSRDARPDRCQTRPGRGHSDARFPTFRDRTGDSRRRKTCTRRDRAERSSPPRARASSALAVLRRVHRTDSCRQWRRRSGIAEQSAVLSGALTVTAILRSAVFLDAKVPVQHGAPGLVALNAPLPGGIVFTGGDVVGKRAVVVEGRGEVFLHFGH